MIARMSAIPPDILFIPMQKVGEERRMYGRGRLLPASWAPLAMQAAGEPGIHVIASRAGGGKGEGLEMGSEQANIQVRFAAISKP